MTLILTATNGIGYNGMDTNNTTLPNVPLMDRQYFAESVGVSIEVVNQQIQRGYIPVIRLRNENGHTKRSFVNIAALTEFCSRSGEDWVQQVLGGKS